MNVLKGVRPLDWVLTAVMVALAAYIGVENVTAPAGADVAHPLDSHSPLIVGVFILAALPILWRRRAILPAIAVSFVVIAASVVAFGWITRCGFALPLSFAMAYAVARFAGRGQNQLIGLVGILALQLVTLVRDASTGGVGGLDGPLPYSVPIAAVFYGIGFFVQSRVTRTAVRPTVDLERVERVDA